MSKIQYVKDTFEEYLSKKDHIAASDIKNFLKSPAYYYHQKYGEKTQKPEARHFPFGSALHEKVMEPELFDDHYVVAPTFDRRTKEGKQGYAEWMENSQGKVVIFQDEMDMINLMAKNADQHPTFVELLKDSYREVSCYTIDEKTGLKVRMRPDLLAKTRSTITDLKSCVDASARKFRNDCYSYGYLISNAFYCDFLQRENYVFAAIEKTPPHQIALYALDDEKVEQGRQAYRMGLDLLKWSYDNKYWCNYNEFEVLKECYLLGQLDTFFDTIKESQMLTII